MPMYYKLFHGRPTVGESMDDWGVNGPTIGPFTFYAETYYTVKLIREDSTDYPDDFIEFCRPTEDQTLIFFRGMYYGDREVYCGEPLEEPIWVTREDFDPKYWQHVETEPRKVYG